MSDPIPNSAHAIIIGAMKCGTSSLFAYLKQHPEICPSITKEPEFFSERQSHGKRARQYSDLWNFDAAVHKYALEGSTGYSKYPSEPNVAENIFNYGIKPKFIYLVRNPYDRIVSHYNFMRQKGHPPHDMVTDHLVNVSNYFLQLERYRRLFPRDDILVLDFDELRQTPAVALARVYGFLGISMAHFPPEYPALNQTQTESRLRRTIQHLALDRMLDFAPAALSRRWQGLLNSIGHTEKRRLTDQERALIHDRLKDSMKQFRDVYGFDVGRWGFEV